MVDSANPSPESTVELETPILLLAMPQVLDPFFQRSVVLLLDHNEEGSVGFILNRPTELGVQEILEDAKVEWQDRSDPPVFFGGPVEPKLGTVLFEHSEATETPEHPELQGLGLTQSIEDLHRLAQEPPRVFRFFLGYSGWGAGQLTQEMMRNDWVTAPVQEELLFAEDPENSWATALRAIGVNPGSLVSGAGAEAN